MDLVSIIIPIYNVEKYLDRCIMSIVQQTYRNLEVILVDDGSPDRCPEICDIWAKKDKRISVIHQPNGGVSTARNSGLRRATGEFILQVDSDDYLAPYAVEHLMRAMMDKNADIVIFDYVKGYEENYVFPELADSAVRVIDSQTALCQIYENDRYALKYVSPCKLCRRQLYEGISYPDGKIFEDIYTTHKLLYRCDRIAVLDEPLFYYYQRPGSIMNASFSMKKLDYLQALVERVEFFAAHDLPELERIAYDELLHSLIWEYSRTRDVLHSRQGMDYVTGLFRQVYRKGYTSRRYPGETALFLAVFRRNPEWIILYWKVSGKLKQLFKRNG